MKVGRLTASDRASGGIYTDRSGPEIERVLRKVLDRPMEFVSRLVPDEKEAIAEALRDLTDKEDCALVVTTGGTGPSPRDVTPEATRMVLDKEFPGFGEIMRARNYDHVKTTILSRATAGIRQRSLIINLPGVPKSIEESLPLLVPAILEALKHLGRVDSPDGK